MALDLATDPGGLFPRLGKCGKALLAIDAHQNALDSDLNEFAAQYASTLQDAYGRLAVAQDSTVRAQSAAYSAILQLARQTVLEMVAADAPSAGRNLTDALFEVRRQMIAQSKTVQSCTVGLSQSQLSGFTGSGVLVTTAARGDGLTQENLFAEVARIACAADSYSGGATAGRESFRYVGQDGSAASVFDYDWPRGSSANQTLSAISADDSANSSGNLLRNGNWETWGGSPAVPTYWATTGTAGTDWAQNSSTPFRGSYDLRLIAGTGATPSFSQTFGSSSGTTASPKSQTSYAVNLWLRRGGVVTGGQLTVDLVDGSGTVVNDLQGTPNSFTIDPTTLATTFGAKSGVFRLPEVLPSAIKFRVRVSTALTGADVYLDDVCLAPATYPYRGGPGVAVFSGSTPFVLSDTWELTSTNDRGGSSYLSTFQSLFDRLFGARDLGLLLPSSGSPNIADTLITA